jgi:hypothetical protein
MSLLKQALADLSHPETRESSPEVEVIDGQIICRGTVMTCGACDRPLPPSALEDGSLMYLGADGNGPSFILLHCPLCPAVESHTPDGEEVE